MYIYVTYIIYKLYNNIYMYVPLTFPKKDPLSMGKINHKSP